MASLANTIYVLDSRQKSAGSTVSNAVYNLAALGSPVEAGTYEMLAFNSRNNVFNVTTGQNDEIYFDEGAAELGPVVIPPGYYASEADLAAAVKIVMDAASGTTYTIVYNALVNAYTFTPAAGTFAFNWLTNAAQPQANLLLGFNEVDGVLAATQTSTRGVDLDPHSQLLIRVTQDGLKNVTLVDGTEYSLIVPLDVPYGAELDALKQQTFDQTIQFINSMNQLDVLLFTEDGNALSEAQAAQYELVIRRLF